MLWQIFTTKVKMEILWIWATLIPSPPPMSMGVEQTKDRDQPTPVSTVNTESTSRYLVDNGDNILPEQPISSNNTDYDKYRNFMPITRKCMDRTLTPTTCYPK